MDIVVIQMQSLNLREIVQMFNLSNMVEAQIERQQALTL